MTVASSIPTPSELFDMQHVVLEGISWEAYETLLRDLEEQHFRLTYDNGILEIMAPMQLHERWKKLLARLIEAMAEELDIEMETLGSTTWRRKDLARGLEPDECYYVAHAAMIHGKEQIDLTIDPPPDLAIEVENTRGVVERKAIYAALGVPEVWNCRLGRLTILRLTENRSYETASSSGVFPFLPMAKFEEFLMRMHRGRQLAVLKEFRAWLGTLR